MLLVDYLPLIVKKIKEMRAVCEAEQPFFSDAETEIENILCRSFVSKADLKGIERFEKVYGITPEEKSTLEERRVNILIRNIRKNIGLSEVLSILQNYNVDVKLQCDYDNDTIKIVLNDGEMDIAVIYKALDEIAPLNVYITEKATASSYMSISGTAAYKKLFYNYIVGKWKIGQGQFGAQSESKKIGGDSLDLKPKLLDNMRETIKGDIAKIVVNDAVEITNFTIEKTDEKVSINYRIRAADAKRIEKVSLRTRNNEEVALLNVNLTIDVDIEITQEFFVQEVKDGI